ncbi:hypothetical protein QQS21_002156 [Conoideocrella luteorostrata]|uniref:Uncharacterized protein n=1 Tax=Conoideocrella luteorostrata TaxID=1105319 RepID=A0AAJ0CVW1_9HYPO|nr:hypothetical protein QQS21_002156 [Conoideocrella luteorostrata]
MTTTDPRPPQPLLGLSAQHERLFLETLPFEDAASFGTWLKSRCVQGSWAEFWHDCLTKNPDVPEPDKQTTVLIAYDTVQGNNIKFHEYNPDKTNWTVEDHYVRFIYTVTHDSRLDSFCTYVWPGMAWKKRGSRVCAEIFEVLCFMKARCRMVDHPPSYSE